MKILIVGSQLPGAIEHHYYFHLKQILQDENVAIFDIHGKFMKYYNFHILNKILSRLNLSVIYIKLNKKLIEFVEIFKPDIIWVFKGMETSPGTLQYFKQKGIQLVNYNPDNPFLFSGRGSGNQYVTKSIGLFDMHLTYDRDIAFRLQKEYNIPVRILPFGFEIHDTIIKKAESLPEINRVCFIGNPDSDRAKIVRLISEKLPVTVFGSKWEKFKPKVYAEIRDFTQGQDFWFNLRRYRVQINLMRPHNPNSHNMRSFEVPGVGGIGLMPDTPDHRSYFKPDDEIFLFQSIEECISKASDILNLSVDSALNIRQATRKRSIESGYNYGHRSKLALSYLEEL